MFSYQALTLHDYIRIVTFIAATKVLSYTGNNNSLSFIQVHSLEQLLIRVTNSSLLSDCEKEKKNIFLYDRQREREKTSYRFSPFQFRYELSVNQMKIIDIDDFPSWVQRQRELGD